MINNPLRKWPSGLLELLSLKNQGISPQQLSPTLTPVLVANGFYGADLVFTSNDNSTGALPRTVTGIIGAGAAAPGPIQILSLSAEILVGAAAGTRLCVQFGLSVPNANAPVHWLGQLFISGANLAAAQTYGVPATHAFEDLVILPGTRIFAQAFGDAGGADHTLRLRTIQRVIQTG